MRKWSGRANHMVLVDSSVWIESIRRTRRIDVKIALGGLIGTLALS
jgi:hypothetical protein